MKKTLVCWLLLLGVARLGLLADDAKTPQKKVVATGKLELAPVPPDLRLGKGRTLNDKYHPWEPAQDLTHYHEWFQRVRTRLLVGLGLWPMPPKTPLNTVIHGTIDKGEYTIEKVYFESVPGHFVTGNLYRPKGRKGKLPAVLNPHGHWQDGRMYDAGEKVALADIKGGGEKFLMNARYPLQAIPVGLARLGCIVFVYDMIGYADSTAVGHNDKAFTSTEAILRGQSIFGLQTWNSVRALDFLETLPDVDTTRIAVTGASGGGTQTFMLCAIDDRPAVAFPAVMVSTGMQGGCICENAPLIRVGSSNVEIAAMFAPRPLGMTGADDWTKEIETKGLPELKRHYALFRSENNVMAKCFPQFKHNYNQVSRELMYAWFNRHLALGAANTEERPIDPVPPAQLSVFDKQHPRPANEKNGRELQRSMAELSDRQLGEAEKKEAEKKQPTNHVRSNAYQAIFDDRRFEYGSFEPTQYGSYRKHASRTTICGPYEITEYDIRVANNARLTNAGPPWTLSKESCGVPRISEQMNGSREFVPTVVLQPKNLAPQKANQRHELVVWITPYGTEGLVDAQGRIDPRIGELLASGRRVAIPDVLGIGRHRGPDGVTSKSVDRKYAGYTFCYNRSLLAERVRDVAYAVSALHHIHRESRITVVGLSDAGLWAYLAQSILWEPTRLIADLQDFEFTASIPVDNARLLPGILKYGGLAGLLDQLPNQEIMLLNGDRVLNSPKGVEFLRNRKADSPKISLSNAQDPGRAAVAWLLTDHWPTAQSKR